MQSPQEFYTAFQASRAAITVQLDGLNDNSIHPNSESIAQIAQSIQAERKKLNEATSFLPSYDRRSYEAQLQELESRVDASRSKNAPAKGKFAFKKKSTTSSTASTPPPAHSHTREEPKLISTESPQASVPRESTSSTPNLQIKSSSYQHFTLSRLTPFSSSPTDLTITDLDHCIVDLLPQDPSSNTYDRTKETKLSEGAAKSLSPPILTAIHIRDVQNTILLLGHVRGSVLASNLSHCVVILACHQLRVHTSHNTSFHLHVSSNAIIEDSNSLTFAPYPSTLPLPPEIRQQKSTHHVIQDFSHLKPTPSPHWSAVNVNPTSTTTEPWSALRASFSTLQPNPQPRPHSPSTIQLAPKGEADEAAQKEEQEQEQETKRHLSSLLAKLLPQ